MRSGCRLLVLHQKWTPRWTIYHIPYPYLFFFARNSPTCFGCPESTRIFGHILATWPGVVHESQAGLRWSGAGGRPTAGLAVAQRVMEPTGLLLQNERSPITGQAQGLESLGLLENAAGQPPPWARPDWGSNQVTTNRNSAKMPPKLQNHGENEFLTKIAHLCFFVRRQPATLWMAGKQWIGVLGLKKGTSCNRLLAGWLDPGAPGRGVQPPFSLGGKLYSREMKAQQLANPIIGIGGSHPFLCAEGTDFPPNVCPP